MRQVFIKETSKRYSIREDGVVISHFLNKPMSVYSSKSNPNKSPSVRIKMENGKFRVMSVKGLVSKHFGLDCFHCGETFLQKNKETLCSTNCKTERLRLHRLTYMQNNPDMTLLIRKNYYNKHGARVVTEWRRKNKDKYAATTRKASAKTREKITRSYAAGKLKIKVGQLSDELYNTYVKSLTFKRGVSKNFGINIRRLYGKKLQAV